jgi:hypothetical protein
LVIRDASFFPAINETIQEIDCFSRKTADSELLWKSFRAFHNSLVLLKRIEPSVNISEAFLQVFPWFKSIYYQTVLHPDGIVTEWKKIPSILERRREKAELYAKLLDEGPGKILRGWEQSGVCWRFNLLYNQPEKVIPITETLRKKGFHASNLYWNLADLFNPADECPSADYFCRRVMNFWVNDSVDIDYIRRCCDSLKGAIA